MVALAGWRCGVIGLFGFGWLAVWLWLVGVVASVGFLALAACRVGCLALVGLLFGFGR